MTTPAEQLSIYAAQAQMSSFFTDYIGIISVKIFGAKGDGLTDDTKAIQSAIDYAASLGGSVIYFPKGVYIYSFLSISGENITFDGSGKGVSILKRKDNFSGVCLQSLQPDFTCKNITVDGNADNNITNTFQELNICGDNNEVRSCQFINYNSQGVSFAIGKNMSIGDCYFKGRLLPFATMGIWAAWEADPVDGLKITGNIIEDNGIGGIMINGKNIEISGNTLRNNHRQTVPTGGGQLFIQRFDGVEGSYIVDHNYIIDGGDSVTSGMEVNDGNVTITNNHIRNNARYGIVLQTANSSNVTISGNKITDNDIGLGIAAGATAINVSGGNEFNNTTQDIQLYEGATNNFIITNNLLSKVVLDGSTGTNKNVSNNIITTGVIEPASFKGSFTHDLSDASVQTITGLGFRPKAGQFFATVASASGRMSVGMCDQSNTQGCVADVNNAGGGYANAYYYYAQAIVMVDSASNYTKGVIAWTNDGFTITWTKAGTGAIGTVTVEYIANR